MTTPRRAVRDKAVIKGQPLPPTPAAVQDYPTPPEASPSPATDSGSPTGSATGISPGNGSSNTALSEAAFLSELENAIRARLIYPAAARRSRIEGTVTLSLAIGEHGALISRKISRSSGSSILDKAALRLVESVFPLKNTISSPFTPVMNISYRLNPD